MSSPRNRDKKERSEKEETERGQGTEDKTSYPNPGKRCTHRGGRTKWKTEERIKERNREQALNQLLWTIQSPLTTYMDHTGGRYFFK